jgi:predicted SprT family Zn-dependent metalloprotease
MDLNSAEVLALTLIEEHCPEYSFKFDNAKKRFGQCLIGGKKSITLSRQLTELNDYVEVRDTILHEIAHAMSPVTSHHDQIWRKNAIAIGCNGQRVCNVKTPTPKYIYECPCCHRRSNRYKKTERTACDVCCRKFNNGKYSEAYKIVLMVNFENEYNAYMI